MDMDFEHFVRRVYDSGWNSKLGADASIYRRMETALANLTTKSLYSTQEERENHFHEQFREVRSIVKRTIRQARIKVGNKFTSKEEAQLEDMMDTLDYSFYDKEKLDEIITAAGKIFSNHDLFEND